MHRFTFSTEIPSGRVRYFRLANAFEVTPGGRGDCQLHGSSRTNGQERCHLQNVLEPYDVQAVHIPREFPCGFPGLRSLFSPSCRVYLDLAVFVFLPGTAGNSHGSVERLGTHGSKGRRVHITESSE